MKNAISDRDHIESVDCTWYYNHFHNVDSSYPGTWNISPSVYVIFDFFHQCLIIFCIHSFRLLQFSSVAQSCPTLCDPVNRSMPGLPVHHQLSEFTQIDVHRISDAIQPSHPLSSPSPPAPNPPSIRVLSSESTRLMRWPKYWSFSLNISSSP